MNDETFLKDVRATMHGRTEPIDEAAATPAGSDDQEDVIERLNDSRATDPALPPSSLHGQGNSVEAHGRRVRGALDRGAGPRRRDRGTHRAVKRGT